MRSLTSYSRNYQDKGVNFEQSRPYDILIGLDIMWVLQRRDFS
ncbi:hypothetical protein HMPREF0495_00984 [Levilactobacillus brevis ATCC 14869 = DSM 20054]|uniref:Uncharacterized protein n=1 Tax=Levilactobacillus brevis ATCC 14869 = DSM 20054 TaxID=649758 RepID=U2P1K2_LEVBR|nr:hypothetical protein HMPREF0495_00984 [Levilactobacillus brevis ATCC 14869 = DSM 20054]